MEKNIPKSKNISRKSINFFSSENLLNNYYEINQVLFYCFVFVKFCI